MMLSKLSIVALSLLCVVLSSHSVHAEAPVTVVFGVQTADDPSVTLRTYDPETGVLLDTTTIPLLIHNEPTPTPLVIVGSTGWDLLDPTALLVHVYAADTGLRRWSGTLHITTETNQPVALIQWQPTERTVTSSLVLHVRANHADTDVLAWALDVTGPILPTTVWTAGHASPDGPSSPLLLDCTVSPIEPSASTPWEDTFDSVVIAPTTDADDESLAPVAPLSFL